MRREKIFGGGLISAGVLGILIYYYLMFMADEKLSMLAIKATIFLFIAGLAATIIWIGYTLITTPPPKSIEEIEREIEEEIKKLEKSLEEGEKQQ